MATLMKKGSPTPLYTVYSKSPPVKDSSKGATPKDPCSPCRSDTAAASGGNANGGKSPLFWCPSLYGPANPTRSEASAQDKIPCAGTLSETSSIRDTDSLFDLADLVNDVGGMESPSHSIASEGFVVSDGFGPSEEDGKASRRSFEAHRPLKSAAQAQSCFERKKFLSKDRMSLTPMHGTRASGLSPAAQSPPPACQTAAWSKPPLNASHGGPSKNSPACVQSGQESGTPTGVGAPMPMWQPGKGPSQPSNLGPAVGTPGLREQVLLRSVSSTRSSESEASELSPTLSPLEMSAECVNFDDVESLSQNREQEKDSLDGITIVALPCHFRLPNSPDLVLYALHFASNPEIPVLAGDESTRLLFPSHMQAIASEHKFASPLPSGNMFIQMACK